MHVVAIGEENVTGFSRACIVTSLTPARNAEYTAQRLREPYLNQNNDVIGGRNWIHISTQISCMSLPQWIQQVMMPTMRHRMVRNPDSKQAQRDIRGDTGKTNTERTLLSKSRTRQRKSHYD
jgi:hypothetical protein